jgi:hypothetical protein
MNAAACYVSHFNLAADGILGGNADMRRDSFKSQLTESVAAPGIQMALVGEADCVVPSHSAKDDVEFRQGENLPGHCDTSAAASQSNLPELLVTPRVQPSRVRDGPRCVLAASQFADGQFRERFDLYISYIRYYI